MFKFISSATPVDVFIMAQVFVSIGINPFHGKQLMLMNE